MWAMAAIATMSMTAGCIAADLTAITTTATRDVVIRRHSWNGERG